MVWYVLFLGLDGDFCYIADLFQQMHLLSRCWSLCPQVSVSFYIADKTVLILCGFISIWDA